MIGDNESFLREHAKEIAEIMEAMREEPDNEGIRAEIAAALSDSLDRKKMRARSVKDTDLYKLAQVVKQAGGERECAEAVKRAFPRRWSIIFEKYNFPWKFSCRETMPPKKMAEGPITGIEKEVRDLEKTVKELDKHVGELTKEIREHEEK
jgi:hypothetical protein